MRQWAVLLSICCCQFAAYGQENRVSELLRKNAAKIVVEAGKDSFILSGVRLWNQDGRSVIASVVPESRRRLLAGSEASQVLRFSGEVAITVVSGESETRHEGTLFRATADGLLLVQIAESRPPPPLTIASKKNKVGMPVIVGGYPLAAGGAVRSRIFMQRGVINAIGNASTTSPASFTIDRETNVGGEGSPIVNGNGQLLGLTYGRIAGSSSSSTMPVERLIKAIVDFEIGVSLSHATDDGGADWSTTIEIAVPKLISNLALRVRYVEAGTRQRLQGADWIPTERIGSGKYRTQLPLRPVDSGARYYLLQVGVTLPSGVAVTSRRRQGVVYFQPSELASQPWLVPEGRQ